MDLPRRKSPVRARLHLSRCSLLAQVVLSFSAQEVTNLPGEFHGLESPCHQEIYINIYIYLYISYLYISISIYGPGSRGRTPPPRMVWS